MSPACVVIAFLGLVPPAASDPVPPKDADGFVRRGQARLGAGKFSEAAADFTEAVRLDPNNVQAFDGLGSAQFMVGKFKESVAAFDKAVALRPADEPGHWRRGISMYYAAQYDRGKRQFEGYEKVDTNDVENAVWHFLCAARKDGLAKARAGILKIGKDKRTPMNEVYALFQGTLKAEDVLRAAEAVDAKTPQGEAARFYAHLYVGIYHDLTGDRKKALTHLAQAAGKYKIQHYMGEVARVHYEVVLKEKGKP
jgi:lipoprotein NlpI